MIARIERWLAHRLGWHTTACLGDPDCHGGPGAVVTNNLCWHRWLNARNA